jgi:FkbM family methyltransferase
MLRRSTVVNRSLSRLYGGTQCKRHPRAPLDLYYDGYRNLGWAMGNLDEVEEAEQSFATKVMRSRPTSCAWDVGANVGFWTLFFAGFQPPIERIVAFEPDQMNLRFLRMNCNKNGLEQRVDVREVALSSALRETVFYADPLTGATGSLERDSDFIGRHYGARRHIVTVTASTMDSEVASDIAKGLSPPSFVKIDVEGHELLVLRGAQATLRQYRPALILEVTKNEDEVGRLLSSCGYRLFDPQTGKRQEQQRPQFLTAALPEEMDLR